MVKTFPKITIIILILALIISGCATGEKFLDKPTNIKIPKKWNLVNDDKENNFSNGWLDDFNDDGLEEVVYKALKSNPDILIAAERVEYSKHVLNITKADLVPNISGGLNYSRAQSVTEFNNQGVKEVGSQVGLNTNLSWEIDVWGRIKALKNSDLSQYFATFYDYESARLSYAAQTAKAWFLAIEKNLLVELSKETLESFQTSDKLLTRRFNSGLSSAMDVRLIRSEMLAAKDSLMDEINKKNEAIRGLKILMGDYPMNEMMLPNLLPVINKPVPPGLPSQLLKRRPDIRSVEERVKSADYKTIASEKALFPSFNLTAGFGVSSSELKNISNINYMTWNLGSGILMPIFQGGKLRSDIKRNSSASKEVWLNYQKVILNAFNEAESAIDLESSLKKREETIKKLVSEAKGALLKAWDSYLAGESEITAVLSAKRSVTEAKKNLILISSQRLMNRIDLYLALGGSFANEA